MDLVKLIDDHMGKGSPLTSYRNRTNHYPSQASVKYWHSGYEEEVVKGACLRAMYYRCTGAEPEPFNTRTYYIFACGNIVEDYFIEQLKQMGLWRGNSLRLYNTDIKLSGEIDILVEDPESKELVIVECKSTAGYYSWKEIAGNKSTKGKAKPAHLLQLMLYLYEFRDQVKKGVLFYFNLENKERAQYIVELVEEGGRHYPKIDGVLFKTFAVEDIHDRYRLAQDYVDKKQLPPCDFIKVCTPEQVEIWQARGEVAKTKYANYKRNPEKYPIGAWECAYCNFRKHCDKDG